MIKSLFNFWKKKLDNVLPAKYQEYIFLLAFIIIVGSVLVTIMNKNGPDKFYKIELLDEVDTIVHLKNGYYFKIGADWYIIKHEIVNHIIIGDSIIKKSNSLNITIKSSNRIKWDKELNRSVFFKEASSPH